jgi:hydroxypyruvate isomerase
LRIITRRVIRADLDDTQEINYPPIFRAIAATGYEGYVGHEFIPKGDPAAALRAAYELTVSSLK